MTTDVPPPTTDLVVVVPGILGSVLGQRTPTKRAEENLVWGFKAGAALAALHNFLGHAPALALPPGIGDAPADDGVEALALMPDLHVLPGIWTPIRGYDVLLEFLRRLGYHDRPQLGPLNLLPFAYDWRLSNRYNAGLLKAAIQSALDRWRAHGSGYADAQVVIVAHSMGGLVARWYLAKGGGAEVVRKLITLGTPWRGAGLALDKLSNGAPVKLGPVKSTMDTFARSLPSVYQLLPAYGCVKSGGTYAHTTEADLPNLETARVADAWQFYADLAANEKEEAALRRTHMLVGTRQPTTTTFEPSHGALTPCDTFGTDHDEFGDGTVPLSGAVGLGEAPNTPMITRLAEHHGNLQCHQTYLDTIQEIITAGDVVRRLAEGTDLRVSVPDVLVAGEELRVAIETDDGNSAGLRVQVTPENGVAHSRQPHVVNGKATARFPDLPPGAYRVEVTGTGVGRPINSVRAATFVWDVNHTG